MGRHRGFAMDDMGGPLNLRTGADHAAHCRFSACIQVTRAIHVLASETPAGDVLLLRCLGGRSTADGPILTVFDGIVRRFPVPR